MIAIEERLMPPHWNNVLDDPLRCRFAEGVLEIIRKHEPCDVAPEWIVKAISKAATDRPYTPIVDLADEIMHKAMKRQDD